MRKRYTLSLLSLLLAVGLLAGLLPTLALPAAAAGGPEEAETVWNMEALPEGSLFQTSYVFDVTSGEGGHTFGYTDAAAAPGKGFDGSDAMALTFTADCPANSFWSDGFILRIAKDEQAECNWLGMQEFWFWLDASEFQNTSLILDLAIDGMHPELGKNYWLVQNGTQTEQQTFASYDGAKYGRLQLPKGFVGWVGIGAEAFSTIFGKIQAVCLTTAPDQDAKNFPLSLYVDEFRIVRGDTAGSALLGDGDLFNKNIDAGTALLYTDMTQVNQVMKAYGASGCWWSNLYGQSPFVDSLLKLVFTDEGAGLNNYRHNIGGGVKDDQSDTYFPGTARAVYSPLTEQGTYDEDRDLGGYTVLMKLVQMGTIDDFTLFMNTPPSTMTVSGATCGDPWADSYSNLREDCYEAYAKYVVDMVQLYNYLGVPVKYVSPINEPQYDWTSAQEGCHYTAEEAMKLWKLVAQELLHRAETDQTLKDVKLSLSESGTWSDKSYVNYVYYQLQKDEQLQQVVDHIGAHSYATGASEKERLAKEMWSIAADIQFHETEYGPAVQQADYSIASAMDVARVMHEDISILDVDSWSYWLAAANGNFTDGLVYFNPDSADLIPTKRLWVMGNYARFTKGAVRGSLDCYALPETVLPTVYYHPALDALVYVIVNNGHTDETFGFAGLPAGAAADVYETSALRNLELRGTMTADSGYCLPAQSVTTFVFHGVTPEVVKNGNHPDNPGGHTAVKDFDFSVYHPAETPEIPAAPVEPEVPEKVSVLPYILAGAGVVLLLAAVVIILVIRKKK